MELFKDILATETGAEDFISSRDLHGNTCLHYIALFDQEDFIDYIFNHLQLSPKFAPRLKALTDKKNLADRQPMDFFKVGKKDSYVLL